MVLTFTEKYMLNSENQKTVLLDDENKFLNFDNNSLSSSNFEPINNSLFIYHKDGNNNDVFDFQNNQIIEINTFDSLFHIKRNNITIKNLNIIVTKITSEISGFLISDSSSNVNLENCNLIFKLTDDYDNTPTTGLTGDYFSGKITKCSVTYKENSYMPILQKGSGWIVGKYAGGNSINNYLEIKECFSTPDISEDGGGISGIRFGYSSGGCKVTATISYSYTTGNIIGDGGGGICGSEISYSRSYNSNSICTITNCYSTGNLYTDNSGGICGLYCGFSEDKGFSYVNIISSFSNGTIGKYGGGICGSVCGFSTGENSKSKVSIHSCYSLGNIENGGAGICGSFCGTTEDNGKTNISIENSFCMNGIIKNIEYGNGDIIGQGNGFINFRNNSYQGYPTSDKIVTLAKIQETKFYTNGTINNLPILTSYTNCEIWLPNTYSNVFSPKLGKLCYCPFDGKWDSTPLGQEATLNENQIIKKRFCGENGVWRDNKLMENNNENNNKNNNNENNNNENNNNKLSSGAIIGIIIGSIFLLMLILILIYLFLNKYTTLIKNYI